MADAYDALRQTLITRIEGMIHNVQRELHANNVEHETLDGLCFRGEQLARQVGQTRNCQCFRCECSVLRWMDTQEDPTVFMGQMQFKTLASKTLAVTSLAYLSC